MLSEGQEVVEVWKGETRREWKIELPFIEARAPPSSVPPLLSATLAPFIDCQLFSRSRPDPSPDPPSIAAPSYLSARSRTASPRQSQADPGRGWAVRAEVDHNVSRNSRV